MSPTSPLIRVLAVPALCGLVLAGCGQDVVTTDPGSDPPAPDESTTSQPGTVPIPSDDTTSDDQTSDDATTSSDDEVTSSPTGQDGDPPVTSPPPSAPAEPADLTVRVDDGSGTVSTWTLSCDPPGGDHPQPDVACGVLGAVGVQVLVPQREAVACTEIYGGDETATIEGTYGGREVGAEYSRTNGCEIAQWDLLQPVLQPSVTDS